MRRLAIVLSLLLLTAALPLEAAREELRRGAGRQFDGEVVSAIERVLDRSQPGFVATLEERAPAARRGGRVSAS